MQFRAARAMKPRMLFGNMRRAGQTRRIMRLRVLRTGALGGCDNMGLDEALLEAAPSGPPTLRFYQWAAPTLSLGYFQRLEERQTHPASAACPVVRRSTGGGAILHDRELTYSYTAAAAFERSSGVAETIYRQFHASLIEALSEWGVDARLCDSGSRASPFLCFQRRARGDVLSGASKICGSAQRRHRGGLLQHGSVLLARSPFAPELPGIAEVSGVDLPTEGLVTAWLDRLSVRQGWETDVAPAPEPLLRRGADLAKEKYASGAWTGRR